MQKVEKTADRIREAMNAKNMRAIDLATATDIPKATISRYLSGVFEPKSTAINKIARVLDASEMWLWGYDVPMERADDQKRRDCLDKVISRMRDDPDFFDVVSALADLPAEEYSGIKILLSALTKK